MNCVTPLSKTESTFHSERHWRVSKGKRLRGAGRTLYAECNAYSVFILFAAFNFTLHNSMDETSFLFDWISLSFDYLLIISLSLSHRHTYTNINIHCVYTVSSSCTTETLLLDLLFSVLLDLLFSVLR